MKRRMLLTLPLLAWPAGWALGQDVPRSGTTKAARPRRGEEVEDEGPPPARRPARPKADAGDAGTEPDAGPHSSGSDTALPAGLPPQAGFEYKAYPIGAYTALDPGAASPQTAIIDWIFRVTTPAPWHGDKPAILCASRSQLRAYNSPDVLKKVKDIVDRFTDTEGRNILSIRVRFVAAADTQWRYVVHQRLAEIGSGPQGQQIWHTSVTDAELVVNTILNGRGSKLLGDTSADVLNGQTLKFTRVEGRPFTGGVQRDSAVGLGYQPKVEKLEEGVVLRISPLVSWAGDTLDAAIELSTNVVRNLHSTRVIAPREVGSGELTIDVPEASETRINQPVKNWPLGETLIISAGIQPGILLENKKGFLNMKIPGTVPSTTELLVIINAEIAAKKNRARGE